MIQTVSDVLHVKHTVKQTGLTCAGPQQCASVNLVYNAMSECIITYIIRCSSINQWARKL